MSHEESPGGIPVINTQRPIFQREGSVILCWYLPNKKDLENP